MTLQTLPERPNLEQLKKQAKSLLQAARDGDPAALARFRILPGADTVGAAVIPAKRQSLALHDAQSVIAREYGFKSWKELHEHVEERSLSFDGALEEFMRCATGNASARALRLLTLILPLPTPVFTRSSCWATRMRWPHGCKRTLVQPREWVEFRAGSRFSTFATHV